MTSDSKPGGPGDPEELVVLMSVFTPLEADMIAGKLEASGIDVYVRHDALSSVIGLTVDGAGQQDVMVRATDLEEAREALGHES